jgi:hypothetical protein
MNQVVLPLIEEEDWPSVYNRLLALAEENNNAELRSYAIEFLQGNNRPMEEIIYIIIDAFVLYKNQELRNAVYELLKEECDIAEFSFYSVRDRLREAQRRNDAEGILRLEEDIEHADNMRMCTYRAFMKVYTLPPF